MNSKLENLNVDNVLSLLKKWQMEEFVDFVTEKQLDGRKLMDVTEGIVKLWRPKVNAKKFILFIEDLKVNPDKYFGGNKEEKETLNAKVISVECQYQTVKKTRVENLATQSMSNVEELLRKIVPAKSFLYRNQKNSDKTTPAYLPMDGGTKKQRKSFFRLSSYEYPNFDILSRFSRQENIEDRGYYSVKTNSRYYIQKKYKRQESRTKYKSLSAAEELSDKLPEDHFYEDLCYNDVDKDEDKTNSLRQVVQVKPCLVKLQELFQSFKVPFLKKTDEAIEDSKKEVAVAEVRETNLYENCDNATNMYDSVHVIKPIGEEPKENKENKQDKLAVEDYLEPVQLSKDYCDVGVREKEETLLGYIISIFENRFGIRRETSDANQSEESDSEERFRVSEKERASDVRSKESARDDRKSVCNMADRPLPVPVENEPYYMNVDRAEAENLLKGHPDGTFVLRPSSQPNHAYTLSVSCANAVHNVGVRRRPDGRLSLGFARRGERSFASVPSLLRHHKRRRLLLVAAGGVIGATTLNDTPHYYQIPKSIPVKS